MKNGICPKCDGRTIVNGMRVLDHTHYGVVDLSVVVSSKPEAWIFKGQVFGKLRAVMCGQCGFTELYSDNVEALVEAAKMQAKSDEASHANPG